MYSGIVECIGIVKSIVDSSGSRELVILAPEVLTDCKIGDSLGVNGVCLTVTKFDEKQFHVTAVPETLRKTNLGLLRVDSPVNMERCIQANTRIGGHYIQGHIDTMIEIVSIELDGSAWNVKFSLPKDLQKYVIKKGFVALDGMSITVVDVADGWFSVTFIPHTQTATIVKNYQVGTSVNLEVDMTAKYIANIVEQYMRNNNE